MVYLNKKLHVPQHASLCESSCSQTAAGSLSTVRPILPSCRNGSHRPAGSAPHCYDTALISYDTDPEEPQPCKIWRWTPLYNNNS